MSIEEKILELCLELPPPSPQGGIYKSVLVIDGLAYFSGHGPYKSDGTLYLGKVGDEVDQEFAIQAARQTGLAILANMKKYIGSLNRVKRVVKLLGLVNSAPDFHAHPAVINGCSELFAEIFGEDNGIGTRSAFGVTALPGNMTVEIEGIFEVS
tara:strand:+ start:8562 stop:9023 length:462 start_codon:yes stop_codon:yes gene_type:complete